jgi:hypothetical protein
MGAMPNVIYFYISFVHIIMHLEMLIHGLVGQYGFGLIAHLRLKKKNGNQNENRVDSDRNKFPMIPQGYGCFVCGSIFETNQDRLLHLEKFNHLDLYRTGSPQEIEEVRRLSFSIVQENNLFNPA